MTLNVQTSHQSSPAYSSQTQAWKWEKKHWLLGIAFGCLVLWWFGSQIKEASWLQMIANWLPLIGSLAFASETMLKLAQ